MATTSQYISKVCDAVLSGAKSAVKYVAKDYVVKATYHGKRRPGRRSDTLVVSIGRPNFAERLFIRKLVLQGVTFPVAKLQITPLYHNTGLTIYAP